MKETRMQHEREFWDKHALTRDVMSDKNLLRVDPSDRHDRVMPWLPYLGMPALTEALLEWIGPVDGRRILDLGTGTGFLATLLATKGAMVHAIDVSGESLQLARRRAELSDVAERIQFHTMPCERLAFPNVYFDAVVGNFVLHHTELHQALAEIRRVLKPDGKAAFIETWGFNPLLMLSRALIPGRFGVEKSSSKGERPLGTQEVALCRQAFPDQHLFVFPELLFLRMLSVLPPLKGESVCRLLARLDRILYTIPLLRRWSYFALVAFGRGGREDLDT